MQVDIKQSILTNNTDNLWREVYFILEKIKVLQVLNIKCVIIVFLILFILIWLLSLPPKYKTLL